MNVTHQLPSNIMDNCDGVLYCFSKWAYNVTDGFFFTGLLLGFCIVLFMATYKYGTPRAYGFASVVGLIGAIWLVTMQLVPWVYASVFILAGVVGFVVMIMNET